MDRLGRAAGVIFGTIMVSLSLLITAEAILRKLFSFSLGGVDELSGYAIAIGAPLAFAVASIEQSNIRINLFYGHLPRDVQAILNLTTVLAIAVLALFFLVFSYQTLAETIGYRALAQTPWATPLIYPQSVWFAAIAFFASVSTWIAGRAVILFVRGALDSLATDFGPERVEAELQDLAKR